MRLERARTIAALLSAVLAAGGLFADAMPPMPALADRPVTGYARFYGPTNVFLRERRLVGERRPDGGVAFTVKASELAPEMTSVEIRSEIARAKTGDPGWAMAQRGLVFDFKERNFNWVQHRGWVYMPYFAMKNEHDTFIAVMEGMRFEHDLVLRSYEGLYQMYPRWRLSEIGSAPYEDMTVVFYQLPKDADYNEMAKVYRSYKFARDPSVRTLKERMKTRPHLRTLADSIAIRQTHAGKPYDPKKSDVDFTPTNEPPVSTFRTYDQTLDFMRRLKSAGVDNVALCVAGWQTGGYDGRCPASFPLESGPGGEAGLRRLCDGARALGYLVDGHSNFTDCFSCSPWWNGGEIACMGPGGALERNGAWSGGRAYNLCLRNAWETFLPAELERISKLGFRGCHYVDVFTAVQPYRCCSPRHPANKKAQMETQVAVARRVHELFGGFASECCMDHLLGYVDYVNYVSAPMRAKRRAEAKGRKSQVDRFVPFFELAFHDVVLSNPDKVTQEVLGVDDNLLLVEYGGRPIFYSINDGNFDGVVRAWRQFRELRHLMTEEMKSHREVAPGVVRVEWANGDVVWVNHSAAAYDAGGGVSVPARDFRLVRAGFEGPAYCAIERAVAEADAARNARQAALTDVCSLSDYSSLVKSVGGTNVWTDALQRALRERQVVRIPASAEPYWIDGVVLVPSNRRIEAAGATVALFPGTRTLMLRNENAPDGTLAPIRGVARDSNVAVVGGRWEDWTRRRRGYGGTGRFDMGERKVGRHFGVSTLFYFGNCDDVTVRDVTFAHTGGFAVQTGDGRRHGFENVRFESCYADGLHLNGNLSEVHVKDVRGKVGDDLVALNAYDWLNSSVNFGPQRNVLCEDLELVLENGAGYPAIRIQPAKFKYADGSVVDCAISDVIFRRVKGIMTFKMYLQTPRYRIGTTPEWSEVGSGGNLFFEDVDIDLRSPIDNMGQYRDSEPVRGHFGAFEFGANLSSVHFRNVGIAFHLDRYPLAHLAMVGPKSCFFPDKDGGPGMEIFDPYVSCRVGTVTVEGLKVRGKAPDELVRATVFDDVNRDGRSSGRGTIDVLSIR